MKNRLKLIDGCFFDGKFILRGILGKAVYGVYNSSGLLSLSRLIHDDEPVNFIIDDKITIFVPVELNIQLKKELILIAKELEHHNNSSKV